MITHFFTQDFSLSDLPVCVAQRHRDNFQRALQQRQASDDAFQKARYLQRDLGTEPQGAARRRLHEAWKWHREQQETYRAMVQDAMEELTNDYPYGFGGSCW